jgi:hypothetical protein
MYSTHDLNKVILFKIKIIIFLKYNYISRMGTGQKTPDKSHPDKKPTNNEIIIQSVNQGER